MARRRWLSTNISIDGPVNRLAMQYGDFAALLFTWMIPAAGDDGTLHGDPDELLAQVLPHRRDVTGSQVAEALAAMASPEFALIEWDRAGRVVRFKGASYYGYQSYIPEARRGAPAPSQAPPDWDAAPPAPVAPPAAPPGPTVPPPAVALICGDPSADQRTKAAIPAHNSANQRKSAQFAAEQRSSPQISADQRSSAQNTAFVNSSSPLTLGFDLDQGAMVEVILGGEGETTRPRPRARESPSSPLVPSLDDLIAAVAAWAEGEGIAPAALRADVGRFRDGRIAEDEGYPNAEAWAAGARKWLANPDFGPKARRAAPQRRAPPGEGRQPPRTEANLAAIVRTRGA